jgi:hypothetical protein
MLDINYVLSHDSAVFNDMEVENDRNMMCYLN